MHVTYFSIHFIKCHLAGDNVSPIKALQQHYKYPKYQIQRNHPDLRHPVFAQKIINFAEDIRMEELKQHIIDFLYEFDFYNYSSAMPHLQSISIKIRRSGFFNTLALKRCSEFESLKQALS